jgi:thioredoxin 1
MVRRLVLTAVVAWVPAFAGEPPAREGPGYQSLDAPHFQALAAARGGLVLDVRTPGEVDRARLADASTLDLYDPRFEQKLALLSRDRPVFVYCASGGRSAQAAAKMAAMGFKEVYDLAGGLRAWSAAGLPVDTQARTAAAAPPGLEPQALDAALKASKRLLVDYQTPWCAPCQRMLPLVEAVAAAHPGIEVLKVDVDESEALAARERIAGVPSFVFYADGRERARATGELTREALEQLVATPGRR